MFSATGHVRVQRVALEHHRDAAPRGRELVDALGADEQFAGGDVLEPGDAAQQRRLAAAGRADEDHELAIANLEVDAVQDHGLVEGLVQALDFQVGHAGIPSGLPVDGSNMTTSATRAEKQAGL
jgi:hypothetical protein